MLALKCALAHASCTAIEPIGKI